MSSQFRAKKIQNDHPVGGFDSDSQTGSNARPEDDRDPFPQGKTEQLDKTIAPDRFGGLNLRPVEGWNSQEGNTSPATTRAAVDAFFRLSTVCDP